jgi:hypothetical protein
MMHVTGHARIAQLMAAAYSTALWRLNQHIPLQIVIETASVTHGVQLWDLARTDLWYGMGPQQCSS